MNPLQLIASMAAINSVTGLSLKDPLNQGGRSRRNKVSRRSQRQIRKARRRRHAAGDKKAFK